MTCPVDAESEPAPPVPDWSSGTELQAAREAANAAIVRVLVMRELI